MASEQTVPVDAKAAFTALLVLAGIASAIENAAIGWLVAPICVLLAWFAIFRAPLKSTMLALIFFAMVLENPTEGPANGQWSTPFWPAGALMLDHIKNTAGGSAMTFSGMDLMLLCAIAAWFLRGRSASKGPLGTPKQMIRLAQLCFVTILMTWLVGKWRGGANFAVWQIQKVIYLPIVYLLCQAAFTGAKDYLSVGKVVLAAAVLRASQAIYVRLTVPASVDPLTGESSLPYATTHHDSMLFAVASVILVALVLQRAGPKAVRLTWLLLPILIGGMIANERRIVWIEIILVFATVYLMTDTNAIKRKVNRALLVLSPLALGYIAVGWGSEAGIFKPVQVIRSAVDSSTDLSTAWRDIENFNLVFTIRQFPFLGVGYGHGFWEMWPMPAVPYELERYVPHNSLLGIYCYGGFLGYAGITALWVAGVYFAVRAYHHSKVPFEKAAALGIIGAILVYYLQAFGDLGLGTWTGVFLVAPSLALAGKLAVSSGAWTLPAPARRVVRAGYAPAQGVSHKV
jgi:hypothetical protein